MTRVEWRSVVPPPPPTHGPPPPRSWASIGGGAGARAFFPAPHPRHTPLPAPPFSSNSSPFPPVGAPGRNTRPSRSRSTSTTPCLGSPTGLWRWRVSCTTQWTTCLASAPSTACPHPRTLLPICVPLGVLPLPLPLPHHSPPTRPEVWPSMCCHRSHLPLGFVHPLFVSCREASEHFGSCLTQYIPGLTRSDGSKPFAEQTDLPAEMSGAVIADHGQLTPSA